MVGPRPARPRRPPCWRLREGTMAAVGRCVVRAAPAPPGRCWRYGRACTWVEPRPWRSRTAWGRRASRPCWRWIRRSPTSGRGLGWRVYGASSCGRWTSPRLTYWAIWTGAWPSSARPAPRAAPCWCTGEWRARGAAPRLCFQPAAAAPSSEDASGGPRGCQTTVPRLASVRERGGAGGGPPRACVPAFRLAWLIHSAAPAPPNPELLFRGDWEVAKPLALKRVESFSGTYPDDYNAD